MEKKKKRWLLTLLAVLTGVALLATLMRPAGISVDAARVERGKLQVTVEEQGRTRALQRYTVAAPISGRLLRTELDAGDSVEKWDIVARIEPPPEDPRQEATLRSAVIAAQARQREAEAALEEAQGNYAQAESESVRRQALYKKGLVDSETRDSFAQTAAAAKARLASGKAALAAAEADVQSARARLMGTGDADESAAVAVPAPVAGKVLRIHEESERVVPAGTALMDLSEGDGLELIIDLLTEEAVQVKPGDPIYITGWGGEKALRGKVRYVEPGAFTKISTLGVEEQRVNVIGDVLDSAPNLGAEFRIEASIVTWVGEDVLLIPTSAIFRRDKAWHTFAVAGGKANLRKVRIGRRGTEAAQVLDGITQGELVIQFPSDLVVDGVRVAHNAGS